MVCKIQNDKMKLLEVSTMSRKTDNLIRIIQDLESRYGKGDPDVQQLHTELRTLKASEETRRGHWQVPYIRKPEAQLPAK
jgi:hypothetical protein